MKNMFKEIKDFMTDEDAVPERFQLCNVAGFGLSLVMLGSKNAIVRALCAVGGGYFAYRMNKEMMTFMATMMMRR